MRAEDPQFIPCFCAVFTLLGLKVLFGSKPVTLGSVMLLACMSSAASTAWVGGTGGWLEGRVAELVNRTSLLNAGGMIESALKYARSVVEEPEQDEL
jgi:hypothetical protein